MKNINDGFKRLTINGPKGVGKSLALAAIYALKKGKSPCLLILPLTLMSTTHFKFMAMSKKFMLSMGKVSVSLFQISLSGTNIVPLAK